MADDRERSPSLAHQTMTPLERGLDRMLSPFEAFVRHQATAGILLFAAATAALMLANSPLEEAYAHLFETRIRLFAGDWRLEMSLHEWINEGLMALFFFLLGLEIKRELLVGDLREPKRAVLVMLAALGGVLVWYWVVHSGIHPTVAGVLVAAAVPARPKYSPKRFRRRVATLLERFRRVEEEQQPAVLESDHQHAMVQGVRHTAKLATTPLQRWEDTWDVPVGLLVLPLFAFANAGVSLDAQQLSQGLVSGVTLGVALGLFLGKAIGISLMTWVGLRTRLGRLSDDLDLLFYNSRRLHSYLGYQSPDEFERNRQLAGAA